MIRAIHGDITKEVSDVIINSANTEMLLEGKSSVAGRINELTEGRLERILADSDSFPKPIQMGEICITHGDVLPCDWVFHLSTHGTLEEMIQAAKDLDVKDELPAQIHMVLLNSIGKGIENILVESEKKAIVTMSIPLIASGTLNMSIPLAAEVLMGALTRALEEHPPKYLEEIRIVTPDFPTYELLDEYI